MIISLIAAVAENNVIGYKGKIPWQIPADFKYFKEITMGHCLIMGQTTHESIGKPLPGRLNIILTFDKKYKSKGCVVVNSIDEALTVAKKKKEREVFVIGGASIYKQFIDLSDKLYITKVKGKFKGDTFFPTIDPEKWKLVSKIENKADEKNPYNFDFLVYERRRFISND